MDQRHLAAESFRECPMCGERMRLNFRQSVDRVPGTAQTTKRTVAEWLCRDCDYFEEVEGEPSDSR
jgi:C4-type Zn-finger protein